LVLVPFYEKSNKAIFNENTGHVKKKTIAWIPLEYGT
jgi:hypothetical protein